MVPMSPNRVVLAEQSAGHTLQRVHQPRDGQRRRVLDQQVHMLNLAVVLHQGCAQVGAHALKHTPEKLDVLSVQHLAPIFCHEDQVNM